jgi:hypothetical protein
MCFVIVVREAEKGASGSFVHRGVVAFIAVLLGLRSRTSQKCRFGVGRDHIRHRRHRLHPNRGGLAASQCCHGASW